MWLSVAVSEPTRSARVGAASKDLVSMRARTAPKSLSSRCATVSTLSLHSLYHRPYRPRWPWCSICLSQSPRGLFLSPQLPPTQPCAHIPPFHRIHRYHRGLRRLRLEITHTCRCPLARPGYRKRGYRYRESVSVFVAVLVFAQELGLMPRMPNRVVKRPRARSQVVHRCRQRRWKSGRPMSSIRYVNYS